MSTEPAPHTSRPVEWDTGRVQVYTGEGKGKTTAAFGLAMRAAGAGLRVFIGQFAKGTHYSELDALRRFDDLVTIHQFGTGRFIRGTPSDDDLRAARDGLDQATRALSSGEYRVVILDEANIAVRLGMVTIDELLAAIDARAPQVEVVVTGRGADPRLIERADLVTEMRALKHYYEQGVQARTGIEK